MNQPLFFVDAFADGPFTGNPAAVCPMSGPADEAWMANVAMEMNQAETAFLWPEEDGYRLRWFTPTVEVDLCGHATLASAHVLFARGEAKGKVNFYTRSGLLTATEVGSEIELDFPSEAPSASEVSSLACLGSSPVWTGRNRMDWFVQLSSADRVRSIQPDMAEIAALGMRGLIVTGRDESAEYDFVSRCFFPASGVPEDPVTGSAHCALAPFWAERLGRTELTGYQASRRGGVVGLSVKGDRVRLRGRTVTTLVGNLVRR